jgi:NAD(P)-dependent dehydrogenase (short-subunit alcohol dehydrogenase family)
MKRVLITGSNRGIGYEFVRQYLDDGWRVYATCRHPSEAMELQRLNQVYTTLSIHRLDITVQEDVMAVTQDMEGVPIDVLINNAGVFFKKADSGLANLHYDKWRRTLEVNTLGTMHTIEALKENICLSDKNRLIVVLTNSMHQKDGLDQPENYYYRSSKAALNATMQGLSVELRSRGIGVLLLEPGEVKTRMGPPEGMTPSHSVSGMRKIIDAFSLDDTGSFVQYDGTVLNN